jgi:hypothetical protein
MTKHKKKKAASNQAPPFPRPEVVSPLNNDLPVSGLSANGKA